MRKHRWAGTGVRAVAGLVALLLLCLLPTGVFRSSSAAAAGASGGPPVLLIDSAGNPFGAYYAEILHAEGLNEFARSDMSAVDWANLSHDTTVVLAQMTLTADQATAVTDWVTAGGHLITMRPDAKLAGLVGWTATGGSLSDGYLKVDTSTPPGQGIVADTMQFHGTADEYTLEPGTRPVAALYSDATTATSFPAVTLRTVGSQGGQVAAFSYDLARSVVYTRQGNPAWAGQSRDGAIPPIRSDNLFFPDWVDFNKIQIPQADEQQRLLANTIENMGQATMPLPRFWYLPDGNKAAVVMTGDDHGNGGTVGRFDKYLSDSTPGCSVADWKCIRSTSYVYPNTPITDAQVAQYQAQGFEIGLHLTTGCQDFTDASINLDWDAQLPAWHQAYPSATGPVTNRTHCIPWSTWAGEPKAELAHGVRLDTNYYYWPDTWVQNRPGLFTGSGMPMRFADTDGSVIDVYQATTQLTDESGIDIPTHIATLLDNALGSKGYYAVVTANMHTDTADSAGSDAIVAAAQARGVPVVSARQMLTWLDGRNSSSFANLAYSSGNLSFDIDAASGANGLQAMLPVVSAGGGLTAISRGGSPVTFTKQTVKGVSYAFFPALSGSYQATYTPEATPPATLTDTTAADFGAGTLGTGTYLAQTGDGEVILAPTVGAEFDGSSLPAGWSSSPWTGGSATVANGSLTVDGARAATDALYGPGRSLEFTATFGADSFEHAGFGQTLGDTSESWAMFSTKNTTDTLYARTDNAGAQIDTPIPGSWIGTPHRYRIDWTPTSVVYSVDGQVVHTDDVAVTADMRPVVSDYNLNGTSVVVDWMRMTPYASSGTFTSRVFDAGQAVAWGSLSWNADLPTGTGLALQVRTGDTPQPDATWSAFHDVTSGQQIGTTSRYLQYQAVLSTSDPGQTPVLEDLTATYSSVTPPADVPIGAAGSLAFGGVAAVGLMIQQRRRRRTAHAG